MNLRARLAPLRRRVDSELDRVLPGARTWPIRLHRAMRYAATGPGKRLRPLLTMLAARVFGVTASRSAPIAVAFELVHAYSLVHDDLPCMDDDDFRRGRLTCHKKFDEATAVLAGDALLTLAFEALVDGCARARLPDPVTLTLHRELARAAGSRGLIAGQAEDLAFEGRPISLARLRQIHRTKTGCLFGAALRSGALVGQATRPQLALVSQFADLFGQIFQITDDILDVVGTFEILGKPIHSDEERDKATYPRLIGLDRSRAIVKRLTARALAILDDLEGLDVNLLKALTSSIPERVA